MESIVSGSSQRQYLFAILITMTGAILFSVKGIFIKFAYQYQVDTLTLLTLRMLISVPLYLAIGLYSERFHQQRISKKQLLVIAAYGVLGYYVASFLDLQGLHYISVSLERVLLYLYPTFVLILSYVVFKQRITPREIVALIIAYSGIVLIFFDASSVRAGDLMFGGLLVVASALVFAVFLLGSDQQIKKVGSVRFTAYAMSAAGFAVFIHFYTQQPMNISELQAEVYGWAALLALFSTLIPAFFISHGVKVLGARKVSVIGVIGPVSTILLGALVMGDRLGGHQLFGVLAIIAAVSYLVVFNKKD